ncbi:Transposase IS66 [Anaerovibrio sp. JC8]|nr:Transposase IS66 [Anaerovibrio sp. JC8]
MSDNSLLEKLKAEYEQKIAEMELRHKQEMDLMKEQLASMRKLLFSSKSERTKIVLPNPDQLSLFDEAEQEAAPEPSEEATTVKAHKRKKQCTQKKLDLSKAERNVVVVDIPEKDRHCPACGSDELVPVGKEHVRDEVRIIPAKIIVDEIYQTVYKCKACENDEHVEFVKAPTPKPLVPNSPVTPSVMTATMLNKFQFALPLQRQEKLWQIMGLNLSKQTMANWIQYAYRDYLKPLIGLMKKSFLGKISFMRMKHRFRCLRRRDARTRANPICGCTPLANMPSTTYGSLNTSLPEPAHVPVNSLTDSMVIFIRMPMQDTNLWMM